MELELRPAAYEEPDARALTVEVQAYYRELYGGTDDSPLGKGELNPPHGAFLLGYLNGGAVAMGGWRFVPGLHALDGRRVAELRRMYVSPALRRRGAARQLLAALEAGARGPGSTSWCWPPGNRRWRPSGSIGPAAISTSPVSVITPALPRPSTSPGGWCLEKWAAGKQRPSTAVESAMTQNPTKIVYTASATTTGGRSGHAVSSDGILDLTLTAPKETGGPGTGTNPEQLFAAGYSACFNSALMMVAKKAGIDASAAQVTANIGFGPEGEGFATTADLEVAIPGVELDQIQQLSDAAHQVCPYSKATRGNVPVTVTAVAA